MEMWSVSAITLFSLRHLSLGKTELTALPCDMFTRSLRCYGDFMEGRSNGLKRLNLGRSIDHS